VSINYSLNLEQKLSVGCQIVSSTEVSVGSEPAGRGCGRPINEDYIFACLA
jgi:hypothetical protein